MEWFRFKKRLIMQRQRNSTSLKLHRIPTHQSVGLWTMESIGIQRARKQHDAKRKQKHIVVKEIKFRPGTDIGDYDVKLGRLQKFLKEGNKTKVTMRFRGREVEHKSLGFEMLNRVERDLVDLAVVEQEPMMEGRQMVMLLAPIKY